jgi:hypothetical protein
LPVAIVVDLIGAVLGGHALAVARLTRGARIASIGIRTSAVGLAWLRGTVLFDDVGIRSRRIGVAVGTFDGGIGLAVVLVCQRVGAVAGVSQVDTSADQNHGEDE